MILNAARAGVNTRPKSIEESEKAKILWDINIQTDRLFEARRPDIVVSDVANKTCQIIDIAVPSDQNIAKKEKEKIDKYQELKLEIMRMSSVKTWLGPIVVGALGCTTRKLEEYLKNIGLPRINSSLQISALFGSANILRKTLDI